MNADEFTSAAYGGRIEDVRKALDAGEVTVDIENEHGMTALMEAVKNGHQELVEFLISRGANMDLQDDYDGWTALIFAASGGHLGVCKLLVSRGANVLLKNNIGESAMDIIKEMYPEYVEEFQVISSSC